MLIIDTALAQRERAGQPIRVAVVGAGFMARGLIRLIHQSVPGMTVAAICNRTIEHAERAYREAGVSTWVEAATPAEVDQAIHTGRAVVTDVLDAVCQAERIDVVVEATGAVEFGARAVLAAITGGKHGVLLNAEVDATVGSALQSRARQAGVVLTGCDGDQPGVELNLYRYVRGLGLTPLVCGNIKGLHDPYRNPQTQQSFAEKWGQDAHMVTSFADGTKISFEQALVANATGMSIERRGMRGAAHTGHVDELVNAYDVDALRALGGVVDYVVGAQPAPGVYVLASCDDPYQQRYLDYYKLGPGPLYSFYTPYHLCHLEVPTTIARAVLFGDAAIQPLGAPTVEVVATAKRPLTAGQTIDGLGGFDTYGLTERADVTAARRLLPIGVAADCVLRRDISRDSVLTYDDVELPPGRLVDELRAEQATLAERDLRFDLADAGLVTSG